MKVQVYSFFATLLLICALSSCNENYEFHEDFDSINNRTWISQDLWTIPIENWKINDGRLECIGKQKNMKTVALTHLLQDEGDFFINLRCGLLNKIDGNGSAGLIIGLQDETDMDIRSLAYFGTGINAGINTSKEIFLGEINKKLPAEFDLNDFILYVDGYHENNRLIVRLQATDSNGLSTEKLVKNDIESFEGAIALVNNHPGGRNYVGDNRFWFDDINITGSALNYQPNNKFGPILWSMYTLNKGILKMSVQMPPLGIDDNMDIELYVNESDEWNLISKEKIEKLSRTAIFQIDNWDSSIDQPYMIVYKERNKKGTEIEHIHEGVISSEPKGRPLVMGGLTCQYNYGFPYGPLVENLQESNPDILYFSGDQIYEGNGGYGIIRFPAEEATLNYLGKWYLFGWAFGDIMKDRPTICIPDDHDVFQGNLWGNGGNNIPFETFRQFAGTSGGYVEPAEMVNAVHRTQCGHLPDCYDPTPMDQGINPYYTELIYGQVSFAIAGDRMFKSGPNEVANWEGRQDHLKEPLKDQSILDPPGLSLMGERQMAFLRNWATDWTDANMKCLLSQTIFSNIATHHGGGKMVLHGDLDSGGWPMTPRDEIVKILRSCGAFHIAGDQHLPSIVQYGVEGFRDAGWAFCTPAITVGYQRRFHPEKLGLKISDRPEHNLENTGKYTDPFGHQTYVYAVGNPEDDTKSADRYERAEKCSSGYGIIHFDTEKRNIKVEAIRFLANLSIEEGQQFPGWPVIIKQVDNYGSRRYLSSDKIEVDPKLEYVRVISEKTGEIEYTYRPLESSFTPWAFNKGKYTLQLVNPISQETREYNRITIN